MSGSRRFKSGTRFHLDLRDAMGFTPFTGLDTFGDPLGFADLFRTAA